MIINFVLPNQSKIIAIINNKTNPCVIIVVVKSLAVNDLEIKIKQAIVGNNTCGVILFNKGRHKSRLHNNNNKIGKIAMPNIA